MKKITTVISALCLATLFGATTSFAQAPASADAPAAAADASKAKAKPAKQFAPQTAKSKECSMKADEQKLHGKARQKFRSDCKKAA